MQKSKRFLEVADRLQEDLTNGATIGEVSAWHDIHQSTINNWIAKGWIDKPNRRAMPPPPVKGTKATLMNALCDYVTRHHIAPSIRELGDYVGLKSTSTIHKHLSDLEGHGYIKRDHRPRNTTITPAGWQWFHGTTACPLCHRPYENQEGY